MSTSNRALRQDEIAGVVRRKVWEYPIVDIHTHLYPPSMHPLSLWGIDNLLGYHYLTAEFARACPEVPVEKLDAMDEGDRAELVWRKLFVERSPMSEATRGVLTVLHRLELDVKSGSLAPVRGFYAEQDAESMIDLVFAKANIRVLYMTNDPMDPVERGVWLRGFELDPRFRPVLRLDSALLNWPKPRKGLEEMGYRVGADPLAEDTAAELRRYVKDWARRIGARYLAVSLPPDFGLNESMQKVMSNVVYAAARELHLPVAMMIGVRRAVNPRLGLAGDGSGSFCVDCLERIAEENPDLTFLITLLAREDQHPLCVAARKFSNIVPFGCWWFVNNPSLIEEMTRMRLDMLGLSFIPQHSDARVLEQLLYKWEHSREIVSRVLADRYGDLARSGAAITEEQIGRDMGLLFDGSVIERYSL